MAPRGGFSVDAVFTLWYWERCFFSYWGHGVSGELWFGV